MNQWISQTALRVLSPLLLVILHKFGKKVSWNGEDFPSIYSSGCLRCRELGSVERYLESRLQGSNPIPNVCEYSVCFDFILFYSFSSFFLVWLGACRCCETRLVSVIPNIFSSCLLIFRALVFINECSVFVECSLIFYFYITYIAGDTCPVSLKFLFFFLIEHTQFGNEWFQWPLCMWFQLFLFRPLSVWIECFFDLLRNEIRLIVFFFLIFYLNSSWWG